VSSGICDVFNGQLAHGGGQQVQFPLLGIGLNKIPLEFSSRPCRAKGDALNQPADASAPARPAWMAAELS